MAFINLKASQDMAVIINRGEQRAAITKELDSAMEDLGRITEQQDRLSIEKTELRKRASTMLARLEVLNEKDEAAYDRINDRFHGKQYGPPIAAASQIVAELSESFGAM